MQGGDHPAYLVCDPCSTRLMGKRVDRMVQNPTGVHDALRKRYGDSYGAWTSPGSLTGLLDEAAEYLGSADAREGVPFGLWQKFRDLAL